MSRPGTKPFGGARPAATTLLTLIERQPVKIGSLFTGVAGLDMAVQEVFGGEHAWFSEIDSAASKVLAYRFPGVADEAALDEAADDRA